MFATKEEFVAELESLPADDCCTQEATAKAMGASVTKFRGYVKVYDVNWRAYKKEKSSIKDELMAKLESLQPNDCYYSQKVMAKAMGISVTKFRRYIEVYDDVNWRAYKKEKSSIKDGFVAKLESLQPNDCYSQATMASYLNFGT